MLLRQAAPEDTRLIVRQAYDQIFPTLSPHDQASFTFDKVFNHVHEVLSEQRALNLVNESPDDYFEEAGSEDCAVATTLAVVDTLMFVLLIIIPAIAPIARPTAGELAQLLAEDEVALNRIQILIRQFRYASKADRVKIIYQIFAGVIRVSGVKKFYDIIKGSIHWYEWALLFVIIVAQIIIWVASDGLAAIAEILLDWGSGAAMILAIAHAATVCGKIPLPPPPPEVDHGFALAPGQRLLVGQKLESLDQAYFAILQSDSNFVIYSSDGGPQWASGTSNMNAKELIFQPDGDLCIYSESDVAIFATGLTFSGGGCCMLSVYGNLSVSDRFGNLYWSVPGKDPGTGS